MLILFEETLPVSVSKHLEIKLIGSYLIGQGKIKTQGMLQHNIQLIQRLPSDMGRPASLMGLCLTQERGVTRHSHKCQAPWTILVVINDFLPVPMPTTRFRFGGVTCMPGLFLPIKKMNRLNSHMEMYKKIGHEVMDWYTVGLYRREK